ncbi:MAG: Gfo/Idh/MocA family oxidoreductase [Beijerinckiaceae bacterium]|nr:Gfo/Idh/MocA family oxidoreductase [Beijerinckiaceae bacterium]
MMNLAIVGLGSWGQRLVASVQGVSDSVRFSTAVVTRPERVAAFADEKGLAVSDDLGAVLADPSIDGVVSSGPPHLHAAHSLAALKAGKHVLAVKPMALTGADARALRDAAQANGRVLALGFNRCFMPNVAAMRRELAAGAIGELLHAEGNFCVDRYYRFKSGWKADPASSPPGGLADHMLYLTIETLGPIADVRALSQFKVSDNALADTTAMLLRTQAGGSALLSAIGVTAEYFRFQIFGSKGWIELRDATGFRLETIDGRSVHEALPDADAERAEIDAFANAATGRAPFPISPDDAVHGVSALEALARSAATGAVVAVA